MLSSKVHHEMCQNEKFFQVQKYLLICDLNSNFHLSKNPLFSLKPTFIANVLYVKNKKTSTLFNLFCHFVQQCTNRIFSL